MNLSTPYVRIDLDIVENNLQKMMRRLAENGIQHRPHIKVHKSVELARKQLEAGACGITVAKLSEAEVMIKGGIKDILVAYALVGEDKFERLKHMLPDAKFTVTVDNLEAVKQLDRISRETSQNIRVLVELKTPVNRGGVDYENACLLARTILTCEYLVFDGLFCYMGIRPHLDTDADRESLAQDEARLLTEGAVYLRQRGIAVQTLSGGTSLTATYAHCLRGITEARAGNYIFNDCNGVFLGYAQYSDCALTVESTVISLPGDHIAIIDAGSKTLTSDTKGDLGYGHIMTHPHAKIVKLNEEHGFVRMDDRDAPLKIGEKFASYRFIAASSPICVMRSSHSAMASSIMQFQ